MSTNTEAYTKELFISVLHEMKFYVLDGFFPPICSMLASTFAKVCCSKLKREMWKKKHLTSKSNPRFELYD